MTVDRQTEIEIRRLYFAEHWKRGTIVAQLGVHSDVVDRVIGLDHVVLNVAANAVLRPEKSRKVNVLLSFKNVRGVSEVRHNRSLVAH